MNLRVLADVDDLAQGADWYDAQRPNLGEDFEQSVFETIEKIGLRPLACRIVYQDFRRRILRSFPYGIYYRLHNEHIVVTLVFHLSRNPELLRRLLRARS